jgi:hypothetical protein
MSYPVRHGEMINCVGMVWQSAAGTPYDGPLVSVVDKKEYSNIYANWEDEAFALIDVSLPIFIYCLSPMILFSVAKNLSSGQFILSIMLCHMLLVTFVLWAML